MGSSIKSIVSNWRSEMPVHRYYLALALLLMVGTGAVFAASALASERLFHYKDVETITSLGAP